MLKKQLILKGVTTIDDWKAICDDIRFDFAKDNYFTELKDAEILEGRINQAANIQAMIGKYYSHEWVRKNVLHQSDEDIEKNDQQIANETKLSEQGEYRWVNPAILNNEQLLQQQEMADQQQQDQMLQPGVEGSQGPDPEMAQKMQEVRNAEVIVNQMKKMPKANRTMADEAKYKAAVQILAKNPDLVQRGSVETTQQQQ